MQQNLKFGIVPRFFNKENFQDTNLEIHSTGNTLKVLIHCSNLDKYLY